MKKLLLLLVGCLITNYAIAMFCGCDYCSKPQQEVKLNRTEISKNPRERNVISKKYLEDVYGVDTSNGICTYNCIIEFMYNAN